MGVVSSRFRRRLEIGDERGAIRVIESHRLFRKFLYANQNFGRRYNNNTAFHFAALYGMSRILGVLLYDYGGNPNERNADNETPLHLACTVLEIDHIDWVERRTACVRLLLQWRGRTLESGAQEKMDVSVQDKNGNTALHLAASAGLEECVREMIDAGSPLTTENKNKLTACDLAVQNGHYSIAALIETYVVFSNSLNSNDEDKLNVRLAEDDESFYSFDVRKLVDVGDFLCEGGFDEYLVLISTAEVLMRDNKKLWMIPESFRANLMGKWTKDLVSCLKLSGMAVIQADPNEKPGAARKLVSSTSKNKEDVTCNICMLTVKPSLQPSVKIKCNHNFCFRCWRAYITRRVTDGMQQCMLCPAHGCETELPSSIIESLVSPETLHKYHFLNFLSFMETCSFIKWCPQPDCGMAVRLSDTEYWQTSLMPSEERAFIPSRAVDCGNGHFFCWDCLGEAHAPSGCVQWRQWTRRIDETDSEVIVRNMRELEELSNKFWLACNSKPCPNCKSPIQKGAGCNHIKCSKCKFKFCWFCLEGWDKHSSATGGYYRCNRFAEITKAKEMQGILIKEAYLKRQEKRGLGRFLRCYSKFQNHELSRKQEEEHLQTMNRKIQEFQSILSRGKETPEKVKKLTEFLKEGIQELLKLRRTMSGSYVYGLYLEDSGYRMDPFYTLQKELEAVTEKLSRMIAGPYIKTPRLTILRTISICRRKRYKFVRAIMKSIVTQGLNSVLKKRKQGLPEPVPQPRKQGHSERKIFVLRPPERVDNNRRESAKNGVHNWLDLVADDNRRNARNNAEPEAGPSGAGGSKAAKSRNRQTQKCEVESAKRAQNDNQPESLSKKSWKGLKVWGKKCRRTEDDKENRRRRKSNESLPESTGSQDEAIFGAAALPMQEQKSDVGVTTASHFPGESCVVKTIRRSKSIGCLLENQVQDKVKRSGDSLPHYRTYTDHLRAGRRDDRSFAITIGLNVASLARRSRRQIVRRIWSSAHTNFRFVEEEEPTQLSPKPVGKRSYRKRIDSCNERDLIPIQIVQIDHDEPDREDSSPIVMQSREEKRHLRPALLAQKQQGPNRVKQEIRGKSEKTARRFRLTEKISMREPFTFEKQFEGVLYSAETRRRRRIEYSRAFSGRASTVGGEFKEMTSESWRSSFGRASEFSNPQNSGGKEFPTRRPDPEPPRLARRENPVRGNEESTESTKTEPFLTPEDDSNGFESVIGLPKLPSLYLSGIFITRTTESENVPNNDVQEFQSSPDVRGRCFSCAVVREVPEEFRARERVLVRVEGPDRPHGLVNRQRQRPSVGLGQPLYPDGRFNFPLGSVATNRVERIGYSAAVEPPRNISEVPRPPARGREAPPALALGAHASRAVIPIHKSTTVGSLSSILYVNENYLSEDDFHEVLFLLGRSPKEESAKKKKSKKDRNKKVEKEPRRDDPDDFCFPITFSV